MEFSHISLQVLRFIFWCLCGWVYSSVDGLSDFLFCSILGLLVWFPKRTSWNLVDSFPAFPLPLLVTWWGIRQSLDLMEGQGWIIVLAWITFLCVSWKKSSEDGTSVLDHWTVWAFGLFLAPWQAGSLGQGMSFGWQTGLLNLLLAERIMARLPLGWRPSRWLPLLVGAFILFYQQSLTGWFVRPAYAWLHLQYQVSLILFTLFFWVSSEWKNKMTILGWSAVPVVLAAFSVRCQLGEQVFGDRFAYASMHPNLLASAFLLAFVALGGALKTSASHRGMRLVGMGILAFGVVATQSRLQITMLVLAVVYVFGLFKPLRLRVFSLVLVSLICLYAVGIGFQILPDRFDFRNIPNERWFIWQAGVYRVLNAPFGEGFLGFGLQAQPLPMRNQDKVWDWYYPHTHNLFMETFLALGFFMGFAVIVFLLVVLFRRRQAEEGFALLFFQFLIGLADFVWFTPFHLAMFVGAVLGDSSTESSEVNNLYLKPAPRLLLIVSGVCLLVVGASQSMSERATGLYKVGWQKLQSGHAEDAVLLMKQAEKLDPRRYEYPLYLAIIEWQRGDAGLDGASLALRRLQKLMPNWDISWVAQALNQVIQGNDQRAHRIFEGLLNTPHPDLSGWRAAWAALTDTNEGRVLSAGKAIARSSLIGELFLGLQPVLEPRFVERAVNHVIRQPLPAEWKTTALVFALDELEKPGAWLKCLPFFQPDQKNQCNNSLMAVCREIGLRSGLGKGALDLSEPKNKGLTAARICALSAFSSENLPEASEALAGWQRWYQSGNEGFPPVEAGWLEALILEKKGDLKAAREKLAKVVEHAPEWMEARVALCRIAGRVGGSEAGPDFAKESLNVLAHNWKHPSMLSRRTYEPHPTGDNWTVLMSRVVIQHWINRHFSGFVPFAAKKTAWKRFWETRLSSPPGDAR